MNKIRAVLGWLSAVIAAFFYFIFSDIAFLGWYSWVMARMSTWDCWITFGLVMVIAYVYYRKYEKNSVD